MLLIKNYYVYMYEEVVGMYEDACAMCSTCEGQRTTLWDPLLHGFGMKLRF